MAITGSNDKTAKVWNLTTGEYIYNLEGHTDLIRSVAVAGNYIITVSSDKTAKVWDLTTGECISARGHTDLIWSVAVTGNYIITGSLDKTAKAGTSYALMPLIKARFHFWPDNTCEPAQTALSSIYHLI